MYIDVTYNFTTITGQIIAVWANNSQPNLEVGRKVIDGIVVDKQGTFRADNLLSAVYQFRYYESSDGIALDAILMPPDYVKAGAVDFAVAIYHYIPGRGETEGTGGAGDYWADPEPDQDLLIDERLKGATVNEVEVQIRGVESLNLYEFEMIPDGGVKLLNGMLWIDANPANIKHFKKIDRTSTSGSTSSAGEAFRPITGSNTLAADSYFKNNFAAYTGTALATLTFPEFSLIPADTWLKFSTHSLQNTGQLVLQFAAGDTIPFAGEDRNRIVLGAGEDICLNFYSDGGTIRGIAFNAGSCVLGYSRAGQVLNGSYELLNTLVAASPSILYDQADFPRLIDSLPSSMIVQPGFADGQRDYFTVIILHGVAYTYYPYRSKFSLDNGAGTFYLPVLADLYLKYGGASTSAGRFSAGVGSIQWNDNLTHNHGVATTGSLTTTADPFLSLRRTAQASDPYNVGPTGKNIIQHAGGDKLNVDNFLNLPLIGI